MKIEVGKYYRTRDGRKVGLMAENDGRFGYEFRFVSEDTGLTFSPAWRADGTFNPHSKQVSDPCDIVAEWHDEPTSPIRTRREIVPGTYGDVRVGSTRVMPDCNDPTMKPAKHTSITIDAMLTADELREAAHILNQIAEVLEDE